KKAFGKGGGSDGTSDTATPPAKKPPVAFASEAYVRYPTLATVGDVVGGEFVLKPSTIASWLETASQGGLLSALMRAMPSVRDLDAGGVAVAPGSRSSAQLSEIVDRLGALEDIHRTLQADRRTSVQVDGRELVTATHRIYSNGG